MYYINGQGPTIERDPTIQALTMNTTERMRKIIEEQNLVEVSSDEIQFVSYEQALKELAERKITLES